MGTFGRYLFFAGTILMVAAFFMPVTVPGDAGILDGIRLANTDLMSQRSMAHLSGAAAMIAGAVFWSIGEMIRTKGGTKPADDVSKGQY